MKPPAKNSNPIGPSRREALREAIVREQARLDRLEAAHADARSQLAALRSELASLGDAPQFLPGSQHQLVPGVPETAADKVRLFRSLFRGRSDVFPTRFVSRRTGKAGYAPACRNKFVPGICELPKRKCGDCPTRTFSPSMMQPCSPT